MGRSSSFGTGYLLIDEVGIANYRNVGNLLIQYAKTISVPTSPSLKAIVLAL